MIKCILQNKTQLYGDEFLYQELKTIYDKWEKLGKPQMGDCEIEFLSLSKGKKEKIPESKSNAWLIDRKFFRQVVHLPKK